LGVVTFGFFGHTVISAAVALMLGMPPDHVLYMIFGGLLPDIDHPKSILGRYNPFTSSVKKYYVRSLKLAVVLCIGLSFFIDKRMALTALAVILLCWGFVSLIPAMKHRGVCHSVVGCAMLATPLLLFLNEKAVFIVFCGAVLHVFSDIVSSLSPWRIVKKILGTGRRRKRWW
jgi:membrane-bound metal-dependent hydrolase YbcI (DUF457 family)